MKNIKRLIAAALALMVLLTFAGCHKKNEIAVTVGEVEFTSAYYMCALVNADAEARNLVYEGLSEEELSGTEEIDYYSKKVEDKDYVEWVEETAMDTLEQVAAYKILCKENELELDEEDLSAAESYAEYYWSTYGYSQYFEPNGVGQETYTQYMKDTYYSERYFEFLYGAGGEKEIASDKVLEEMYDKFIIADVLEGYYDAEMVDEEKEALKSEFEGYLSALTDGSKTFEEVYKEYNQITDEEETETTTEEESTEPQPKDEYASIIGAEGTVYEAEYFETVKAMAVGEVKLINLENDAGLALVVKQDIKADDYYKDTLDMTARHLVADEEFEATIADYIKELEIEVNDYAVKQFKVKKIIIPETTTA